jgi:hypothetical protein
MDLTRFLSPAACQTLKCALQRSFFAAGIPSSVRELRHATTNRRSHGEALTAGGAGSMSARDRERRRHSGQKILDIRCAPAPVPGGREKA